MIIIENIAGILNAAIVSAIILGLIALPIIVAATI